VPCELNTPGRYSLDQARIRSLSNGRERPDSEAQCMRTECPNDVDGAGLESCQDFGGWRVLLVGTLSVVSRVYDSGR
jgi:hypothetical protein